MASLRLKSTAPFGSGQPTSDRPSHRNHPWRGLEKNFQRIVRLRRNGQSYRSPDMEPHFQIIALAVDHTAGQLSSLVRWRVPAHDAGDAAQQWHRYMLERGFDKYDPHRPFYPFGYKTLLCICLGGTPSAWRRQRAGIQGYDVADDRCNPFHAATKAETRQYVGELVASLPPTLRDALIDQYWLEVPAAESAEAEGCPRNTIDSRRWRGKEALRKKIGSGVALRKRFEF